MLELKRYPKRSPYWVVRGTVKGVRIFESTGTTDKAQADAYRRRLETQLYERRALGLDRPATFADAVNAYLDHHGEGKRFVKKLLEHFKERPLSEIGQAEIDRAALTMYPDAKPSTRIRQVYTPAIAIMNHAVEARLPGATYRKIKLPKIVRPETKWATDEHVQKLLPHCTPGVRAIVLIMTYTGLRISECLRMTPVDFTKRPGWVEVGKTKNGESALVPLPSVAVKAIEAVGGDFGYRTLQGVNKVLQRAATAAKVPYLSTHSIGRHTFAARLLSAGHDIKLVKEAGRWKKLAIVDEIYGHLEQRHVHDAMLAVATGAKRVQKDDANGTNGA